MLDSPAPETIADANQPIAGAASRDVTRVLVTEAMGAGILTFLMVAAGAFAERYAGGSIGLALLVTALAAAGGFAALARALGTLAPSLFNPAYAFGLAISGKLPLFTALAASAAQIAAACLGVMLAHLVTNTGHVQVATQIQTGAPVWAGEFVATALVIFVLLRLAGIARPTLPLFGGLALLAVVLATPSLSLANPAVTLARGLTDSFTSIRLADAGLIVACQFGGALAASLLNGWLFAGERNS
jgi:glycerol uptake facilitator-like aquaporin